MRIPSIDARDLFDARAPGHARAMDELRRATAEVGFFTLHATALSPARVEEVLAAYRAFFRLPAEVKAGWDMAATGANRGWGASRSEQVDPEANPDWKEVFDCGHEWPESGLRTYAPNLWPDRPAGFRDILEAYFRDACAVALDLLGAVAVAAGGDGGWFADKFDRPMALLRGNYYPERPAWAGAADFGIAPHTDYGCLTLLATDGAAGLEVRRRDGGWVPVTAGPGRFVVNFGEMLECWSGGRVRATPHRVVGGPLERVSVPLFFNPRADVNVAPPGSGRVTRAAEHLQKRYDETYLHLKPPAAPPRAALSRRRGPRPAPRRP